MAGPVLAENVNSFDKKFYQALASRAAKFARESDTGMLVARIPIATGISFNQNQYKKPIYEESKGVGGGVPTVLQDMMTTAKDTKIYNMKDVYAHIHWEQEDVMQQGEFLVQQKQEQLEEWTRQANLAIMKGVQTKGFSVEGLGQGSKLNYGALDQATMVLNLNGGDSKLDAAGDVYLALVNFLEAIPYQYRSGKKIVLGATPGFYDNANKALFTNDSGFTEWEQFFRLHVKGQSPLKVSEEIIWSNDLFLDTGASVGNEAAAATQYDAADGSRNNAYTQESDTLNIHDRLFAAVMEPNIIERAYSRGFSLRGEAKNHVGGITQTWTVKEAAAVHRPLAVLYSEQISWV